MFKWCNNDESNRTGIEIDNITTSNGYSKLINEPTHFVNNTSSSIDLIFSSDIKLLATVKWRRQFMKNIIIILYTRLWISM